MLPNYCSLVGLELLVLGAHLRMTGLANTDGQKRIVWHPGLVGVWHFNVKVAALAVLPSFALIALDELVTNKTMRSV